MIGHQTKCVHFHVVVTLPALQGVEVIRVIVLLGKDDLSVMTPLDDMVGTVGNDQAGLSRHVREHFCC